MLINNVAIVTGCTRGIGNAISKKLAQEGCRVVGVYKQQKQLAKKLESEFASIKTIQADVGDMEKVTQVINATIKKYGTLDFVINNVGIDIFGKIENYDPADWDRMIKTNLTSVFLFSKYSIPYLRKSKNPVIVNITSRLGFPEFTEPKSVAYSTVKSGITTFTVGLSKELKADGIRVNAVLPTPTKTDLFDEIFTPQDEEALKKKGKLGKPEEVADLVLELIHDKTANGKILFDKRVHL